MKFSLQKHFSLHIFKLCMRRPRALIDSKHIIRSTYDTTQNNIQILIIIRNKGQIEKRSTWKTKNEDEEDRKRIRKVQSQVNIRISLGQPVVHERETKKPVRHAYQTETYRRHSFRSISRENRIFLNCLSTVRQCCVFQLLIGNKHDEYSFKA